MVHGIATATLAPVWRRCPPSENAQQGGLTCLCKHYSTPGPLHMQFPLPRTLPPDLPELISLLYSGHCSRVSASEGLPWLFLLLPLSIPLFVLVIALPWRSNYVVYISCKQYVYITYTYYVDVYILCIIMYNTCVYIVYTLYIIYQYIHTICLLSVFHTRM